MLDDCLRYQVVKRLGGLEGFAQKLFDLTLLFLNDVVASRVGEFRPDLWNGIDWSVKSRRVSKKLRSNLKDLRWNVDADALQGYFGLFTGALLMLQRFPFGFFAIGLLQQLFALKLLLQLSSRRCCYRLKCWTEIRSEMNE